MLHCKAMRLLRSAMPSMVMWQVPLGGCDAPSQCISSPCQPPQVHIAWSPSLSCTSQMGATLTLPLKAPHCRTALPAAS